MVMVIALNQGQPALLYLGKNYNYLLLVSPLEVPCTLIPTALFGWKRGDFTQIWTGTVKRYDIEDVEVKEHSLVNDTEDAALLQKSS
jgi:hypothetical protein